MVSSHLRLLHHARRICLRPRERRNRSHRLHDIPSNRCHNIFCLRVNLPLSLPSLITNLLSPQISDAADSVIASLRSVMTKNGPIYTPATPTTTNKSLMSLLASLSAANAVKITKVTPHVLTTLNPSNTGTKVGALQESQSGSASGSGSVLAATSAGAGSGGAGLGRSSGVWEISSGIFGLCVGVLGVFL